MPTFTTTSTFAITQTTPAFALDETHVALINQSLSNGNDVRVVSETSCGLHLIQRRPRWFTGTTATSVTPIWTPSTSSTATSFYYNTTSALDNQIVVWYNSGQPDDFVWETVSSTPFVPPKAPYINKKIDAAKASIKRALKLMSNFGMENDIRVFLGGNEIEVSHPNSTFKFVLKRGKYKGLIQNTHSPTHAIPYDLSLYTKCNVHVADLCVIMENTPVLDQVLALAMFIKTGNEEEILRKANFFNRIRDDTLRELIISDASYLSDKLHIR